MPRTNDYPLDNITNPGPNDVLCIQAKCNHPGNVKFRKLAERNKQRFKLAKRGTKNDVAMDLVRKWRAMDPPGRFLAKMEGGDSQQSQEQEQQEEDSNNAGDDDNGSSNETEMTTLYYDVGDEKACTKARLSLRPSKGGPKLIEPDNSKKSKWWKYFNLYDPEYHPDKKDDAMCKFCGGDIAVKDGSAGDLCNHLKKYHVKECSELSKQAEQQTVVAKKKKPDDSVEIIEKPKLVKPHVNKPWSKYGKYWTHFMRYDAKGNYLLSSMIIIYHCYYAFNTHCDDFSMLMRWGRQPIPQKRNM